jgi:hypothetical protein
MECEVPWLEDEGIRNLTSRPGDLNVRNAQR